VYEIIFGGQKYDFIMGGISITIQTLLQSGKYLDFDLSVEYHSTYPSAKFYGD
jgi:hypothetical protein